MDIKLSWFRGCRFDGNIYVQCHGDVSDARIKYSLLKGGELLREKSAFQDGMVVFENLELSDYDVLAKAVMPSGKVFDVGSVSINIPESARTASFMELISNDSMVEEVLDQFGKTGEGGFIKGARHEIVSLKGGLELDSGFRNNLQVMFVSEGYDKLLGEKKEVVPVYFKIKELLGFKPVFDRAAVLGKTGVGRGLDRFTNLYRVETDVEDNLLLQLAKELEKLEYVEYCSLSRDLSLLEPPPLQLGQAENSKTSLPAENAKTPDFSSMQGYLDEPLGMNVRNAWNSESHPGYYATVRHLDFGIYRNHEDLSGQRITVVNSRPETEDCNHGTASTGCIVAGKADGRGVAGVAHDCRFYFYDTGDTAQIVADFNPGDIVSFDIQLGALTGHLVPFVHNKTIWDYVGHCVKGGAVVVFAAGNGGLNLKLNPLIFRNYGNNGALMVGACGSASELRHSFSNFNLYGALNSWGDNVTTTGYGELQDYEGNDRDYTQYYDGTSSATPLVAGALACIQSYVKSHHNVYLNCQEMLALVSASGYQKSAERREGIGARPNVAAAIATVNRLLGD
ncbi:S8 family serine peptidase [Pseudomonas sp. GM55]|uniref:S8 family serine peptidase n=1 Tax=Pseudomonas sp. GM55 TaxID=1144333 RepID=UPI0002706FA8|nr:S8 family serine peptidase [Pseudomonas sp. GM55]EJM72696.1 subtilisin-like serine protease [Pseudomonas sp. GM55]